MSIEIGYFNSYIARRLYYSSANSFPNWLRTGSPVTTTDRWFVEEARIRGGFNNTKTDYGVKAYIVEDEPSSQVLSNGLIYSGIFNSRTGFNETNVFSVGESITKSVDPRYGSIQKLYAEDTNLTIFQEKKVSRALIDKDAIYSAEGGGTVTSTNLVIGQIVPYAGEFGISKDPESFAVYGYQKYFTDRKRNAVLRLSRDGITEISNYGMKDYFRDEFNTLPPTGKIKGGYDVHNKTYVLSLQNTPTWNTPINLSSGANNTPYLTSFKTLYYDESVKGWPSFATYKPTLTGSIGNVFFSFNKGALYKHYQSTTSAGATIDRNKFYGLFQPSSITFTFNPKISAQKVFKTINYEGSSNWEVESLSTQDTGEGFLEQEFDVAKPIKSLSEGLYYLQKIFAFSSFGGTSYVAGSTIYETSGGSGSGAKFQVASIGSGGSLNSLTLVDGGTGYKMGDQLKLLAGDFQGGISVMGVNNNTKYPKYAGFNKKENKYFANIVNNSTVRAGEVVFGKQVTGIKGFFATCKIKTSSTAAQELFAVSSEYVESSY